MMPFDLFVAVEAFLLGVIFGASLQCYGVLRRLERSLDDDERGE